MRPGSDHAWLPHSRPSSAGRPKSRRLPTSCGRTGAPRHPDRPRRRRQDPPGPPGRRGAARTTSPTASASSPWRPCATRPWSSPRSPRRSDVREHRRSRRCSRATARSLLRDTSLLLVLDNFEQVVERRAEVGRPAGRLPGPQGAGHQPRACCTSPASTTVRSPPLALPARRRAESAARADCRDRGGRAVRRAGAGGRPDFALTDANAPAVVGDLPAAGRAAAGASSWPPPRSAIFPPPALLARLERRLPLLDRRPPRPARPAADDARRHRLELRPARPEPSSPLPPPGGLRRRLHAATRPRRSRAD